MEENKTLLGIGIAAIVTILIGLVLLAASVESVGAGERGVLLNRGAVSDEIKQPGWHMVMPFTQNIVTMDVQKQKIEVGAASASRDLQSVNTTVALNYHLDPSQVHILYRDIGKDYEARIIAPALQEAVKAATSQFTAEELITKRPEVGSKISEVLQKRLNNDYVVVDTFSIVNFAFSSQFASAIEAKQTAEQEAKKAENDLRRIEVEAEQTITQAKAEAESIRIQGDALRENEQLVELKKLEVQKEAIEMMDKRWNGALPQYSGGDNPIPFINVK